MKTIVVVADAQDKQFTLLHRAQAMAELYNAQLHILDAVYVHGLSDKSLSLPMSADKAKQALLEERKKELAAQVKQQGLNPRKTTIEVVWSKDLFAAVCQCCDKTQPLMVIKRVLRKAKQLFHTPTDWRLVERCPVPLFLSAGQRYRKRQRVLVALDLATKVRGKKILNEALLAKASEYASATGAEIHVVHCIAISEIMADLEILDLAKMKREARQELKPEIARLSEQYHIPLNQFIVKSGQPEKVIDSQATKLRADITFIGSAGRRGLKGRLLGNTAELMLRNLHTDLMLLRP